MQAPAPAEVAAAPRAPFLLLAVWVGLALGLVYVRGITIPTTEPRMGFLHEMITETERIPPGYLFAMYAIGRVQHAAIAEHGVDPMHVFVTVDMLGLVFACGCAGLLLAAAFKTTRARVAGLMWIAASSPLLFADHIYHPSDFYGVGLMCLMLLCARGDRWLLLGVLCALSGVLWEKALLVPIVLLLTTWRGRGFGAALGATWPAAVGAAVPFIGWRAAFWPHAMQPPVMPMHEFLGALKYAVVPWLVFGSPVLVVLGHTLVRRRAVDRFWIGWLLYWPLLLALIVVFRGYVGELRSFWVLQPIFAGLIATWAESH